MKYEDLERVNTKLQTVDIKGKDYVQVNKRILAFRELFPMGCITTEILSNENGTCLMKATITDGMNVLGVGHAYEKEQSSYINKTSYVENCETSAVGRALAMVGIGVDASMCSAEELVNAIKNQGNEEVKKDNEEIKKKEADAANKKISAVKVKTLIDRCKEDGVPVEKILNCYKLNAIEDVNERQLSNINQHWEDIKKL